MAPPSALPFIRWLGGKRAAADEIQLRLLEETGGDIRSYAEPFIGGGAVFLKLLHAGALDACQRIVLGDTNPVLVHLWTWVLGDPHTLVCAAEPLFSSGEEDRRATYELRRDRLNHILKGTIDGAASLELAALYLWINSACHGGIFRTNSSGEFNVYLQADRTPRLYARRIIEAGERVGRMACEVRVVQADFRETIRLAEEVPGAVSYCDPPYHKRSIQEEFTSKPFTSYTADGFGPVDQLRLAALMMDRVDPRGPLIMTSNANNADTRRMYWPLRMYEVGDRRSVSRDSTQRQKVNDLLVISRLNGEVE